MDERELSLFVVGIDYANPDRSRSNRRFEIALCRPGDPVELRPEPRNKHDPRAVAVFSERGIQLGYLTAERCGWIGAKIAGRGVRRGVSGVVRIGRDHPGSLQWRRSDPAGGAEAWTIAR